MNEIDRHGTLPHRRSHPPDHVMENVARGKDARHAGLQQEWVALQRPAPGPPAIVDQVLPGVDEPGLTPFHHTRHHIGVRGGPDEDEHSSGRNRLGYAGLIVPYRNGFQPLFARDLNHFRLYQHLYVLPSVYLVYKVMRHLRFH